MFVGLLAARVLFFVCVCVYAGFVCVHFNVLRLRCWFVVCKCGLVLMLVLVVRDILLYLRVWVYGLCVCAFCILCCVYWFCVWFWFLAFAAVWVCVCVCFVFDVVFAGFLYVCFGVLLLCLLVCCMRVWFVI